MRRFDADADVRVGQHDRGGQFRIHFVNILFEIALHPGFDDVDEGKNAGLGLVDHRALEVQEMLRACCAGIDDRRDAGAK